MNTLKMYVVLTAVMFFWGLNLPAVKFLTAQMEPVMMTSIRILIASLTIFLLLSFIRAVRYPTKKEWGYVVAGSLLNVAFHHYFLSIGLTMTSGTNAGLIIGTAPILTAILSLFIIRNQPTKLQWIGFILGLVGVWTTVFAGNDTASTINLGDSYIFLAILSQVLSFLIIKKAAETFDPRLLTAYMFLIGSLLLFCISFLKNPNEIYQFKSMTPTFWYVMLGSAIVATALGHMLYNYSIHSVGPNKSAIFINLATLFSLLGAVTFLGEKIAGPQIIGLFLIIGGVVFGSGAVEELNNKHVRKNTYK